MQDEVVETDIPAFRFCDQLTNLMREHDVRTHHYFPIMLKRHRSIGPDFWTVVNNDPGYISDLSLRRSLEPIEYFQNTALSVIRNLGARGILTSAETMDRCLVDLGREGGYGDFESRFRHGSARDFVIEQPGRAAQIMCCYVNYLGSWSDAEDIASAVITDHAQLPRTRAAAALVTLAANVYASAGSVNGRTLYAAAAPRWEEPLEHFFTLLRAATAEVKRIKDPEHSVTALLAASAAAGRLADQGLSQDAQLFAQAMTWNLAALHEVRLKNYDRAGELIRQSLRAVDECDHHNIPMELSRVHRYVIMIKQNEGILAMVTRRWQAAAESLDRTVDFTREWHRESEGETLSLLGYALFHSGRAAEALKVLVRAESLVYEDISPPRLRQVRKLLAVVEDRLGDDERARRRLESVPRGYAAPPTAFAEAR